MQYARPAWATAAVFAERVGRGFRRRLMRDLLDFPTSGSELFDAYRHHIKYGTWVKWRSSPDPVTAFANFVYPGTVGLIGHALGRDIDLEQIRVPAGFLVTLPWTPKSPLLERVFQCSGVMLSSAARGVGSPVRDPIMDVFGQEGPHHWDIEFPREPREAARWFLEPFGR